MKDNLLKRIWKGTKILTLVSAIGLGSCNSVRYEINNKGELKYIGTYLEDWDIKEINSNGQTIYYDIEPDLKILDGKRLRIPKEFKLEQVKIDGIKYSAKDSSILSKAEQRIKKVFYITDSSIIDYGLKALE